MQSVSIGSVTPGPSLLPWQWMYCIVLPQAEYADWLSSHVKTMTS